MVLFGSHADEPTAEPFEVLLESRHVQRVYLPELAELGDGSFGLELLKLLPLKSRLALARAHALAERARREIPEQSEQRNAIELIEKLLAAKFPVMTRKEIEIMLNLDDLSHTQYYKDIIERGRSEGKLEGKLESIPKLSAIGLSIREIAEVLELSEQLVSKYFNPPKKNKRKRPAPE